MLSISRLAWLLLVLALVGAVAGLFGPHERVWGIDLGANFVLRQGYGEPFFRSRVSTGDALVSAKDVLISQGADQFRLDAVSTFDFRAEKMFKFAKTNFAFDFDVFNLFNSKNLRRPEVTNLIFNFDGTVQSGVGDPRQMQLGVRLLW